MILTFGLSLIKQEKQVVVFEQSNLDKAAVPLFWHEQLPHTNGYLKEITVLIIFFHLKIIRACGVVFPDVIDFSVMCKFQLLASNLF